MFSPAGIVGGDASLTINQRVMRSIQASCRSHLPDKDI
jgi:hypothetical protein